MHLTDIIGAQQKDLIANQSGAFCPRRLELPIDLLDLRLRSRLVASFAREGRLDIVWKGRNGPELLEFPVERRQGLHRAIHSPNSA